MKNQYFGDVNDYRKYGLLRALARNQAVRIAVCWMLTQDDTGPDGRKVGYLDKPDHWQQFDPKLFDFLRRKVKGHETEAASRKVTHFNDRLLPGAVFWNEVLADAESERTEYFGRMWNKFSRSDANLVFFDPDNGLAGKRKKSGSKYSSKFLFHEELRETLQRDKSALIYQHFGRSDRKEFIGRISKDLGKISGAVQVDVFMTPHVAFFLVAHQKHKRILNEAKSSIANGPWSKADSCKTCRTTDRRQILVCR